MALNLTYPDLASMRGQPIAQVGLVAWNELSQTIKEIYMYGGGIEWPPPGWSPPFGIPWSAYGDGGGLPRHKLRDMIGALRAPLFAEFRADDTYTVEEKFVNQGGTNVKVGEYFYYPASGEPVPSWIAVDAGIPHSDESVMDALVQLADYYSAAITKYRRWGSGFLSGGHYRVSSVTTNARRRVNEVDYFDPQPSAQDEWDATVLTTPIGIEGDTHFARWTQSKTLEFSPERWVYTTLIAAKSKIVLDLKDFENGTIKHAILTTQWDTSYNDTGMAFAWSNDIGQSDSEWNEPSPPDPYDLPTEFVASVITSYFDIDEDGEWSITYDIDSNPATVSVTNYGNNQVLNIYHLAFLRDITGSLTYWQEPTP